MKARTKTLAADQLAKMDAYWRAANYLSVGQIHLHEKAAR
jgi:xylulose-5-phosphate/fructose-6-phosphate phosphoketolase